jgi:hypothetical protein
MELFVKNVKRKRMKKNNGFSSGLLRSGYDRCRRGFISVYGVLYEQKRAATGRSFAESKNRK